MKKTIVTLGIFLAFTQTSSSSAASSNAAGNAGQKATINSLRTEIANQSAADATLQENITNISLTPGPQGDRGPDGEKGETPPRGFRGPPGSVGARGPRGTEGDKGQQGDMGEVANVDDQMARVVRLQQRLSIQDFDLDGYTPAQGDCNDADNTIHPDQAEIPGDKLDNNCDGNAD